MVTPPLLLCSAAGRYKTRTVIWVMMASMTMQGDIAVWSTCVPGNNYMHVVHAILENANKACCASNRCGSTEC